MHFHKLSCVVLAAGMAAGCAVGPQYIPPATPQASRYIGQAGSAPLGPQATAELANWWQRFDDPLLARFVTMALEQNLELSLAQARVAQARAGRGGGCSTAAIRGAPGLRCAGLPVRGNTAGKGARQRTGLRPVGQCL